jgi:hypothetical protein
MASEHWKDEPEAQDFPAAKSYLSLLMGLKAAGELVKTLRKEQGAIQHFAAKDILRAAGLPLLAVDDSEVANDLEKVKKGIKLSPVLLVQGAPLWIADGYHRVCASYHLNEKEPVPCLIAPRAPER